MESGMLARRRKLMMYADAFGQDRQDRLDFTEMILRRDVETWKTLTSDEMNRMLDAYEGATLLLAQRANL